MAESFVEHVSKQVREQRQNTANSDVFTDMAAVAAKHNINMGAWAAISASMLLMAVAQEAKLKGASPADLMAAALQIVAEMTTNPKDMEKLWTSQN